MEVRLSTHSNAACAVSRSGCAVRHFDGNGVCDPNTGCYPPGSTCGGCDYRQIGGIRQLEMHDKLRPAQRRSFGPYPNLFIWYCSRGVGPLSDTAVLHAGNC